VRHFGDLARVELSRAELTKWSEACDRARLDAAVMHAGGYARVELDPRGFRSGALNETMTLPSAPGAALSGD
jgi:PP-loop superfamily ATP-utilizing enzyme